MAFARYFRDEAAQRVPLLVGSGHVGDDVLGCLAQAMKLANAVQSAMWALTLLDTKIRLTFGPVEVFRLDSDHVWFAAADLEATVFLDTVERTPSPYKSQPGAEAFCVPHQDAAETFVRAAEGFRLVLDRLARRSKRNLNASARTAHARGLVEYLEERVGDCLPRPAWDVEASLGDAAVNLDAAAISGSLEGRLRLVHHFNVERSSALVRDAKALWRSRDPMLRCEVCDHSFLETFGAEYIEAHHRLPLEDLDGEPSLTAVADLAPMCANCRTRSRPTRRAAPGLRS